MQREFGRVMFTIGLALLLLATLAFLLGMNQAEFVVDVIGAGLSLVLMFIGRVQMRR
ncbi:MAG: hypothetical protein K6T83_08090 [Alicyclobacillus sp.]|nr:hypothetical protein [Alicyclobacillus sp.]